MNPSGWCEYNSAGNGVDGGRVYSMVLAAPVAERVISAKEIRFGQADSVWPNVGRICEISGEWRVAHTKPRQEKALLTDFIRLGIQYCCPLYAKATQRKDCGGTRKVLLPAFPGYVSFASVDNTIGQVMKTDRIMRVLPIMNQEKFVTELQSVLEVCRAGIPFSYVNTGILKKGQTVKIISGPLQGCTGKVIDECGKQRVALSVEMFSQAISVEIEPAWVKVIADAGCDEE